MSAERDETRIVRSWLEDGVTVLPDRVLDAVLDQLPATHQRRAWWPARRFLTMSNVPSHRRLGPRRSSWLPSSATGSCGGDSGLAGRRSDAHSHPEREFLTCHPLTYSPTAQDLEPGLYRIPAGNLTPADLTFTVPAGWQARYLGFTKHMAQPGEMGLVPFIVTHVYTDACAAEGEFELAPIGPPWTTLPTRSRHWVGLRSRRGGHDRRRISRQAGRSGICQRHRPGRLPSAGSPGLGERE